MDSLEDLAPEVLGDIGHVADSVAVGKKIPATGAVAVVVQPGAEDEVGCDAKEEAEIKISKVWKFEWGSEMGMGGSLE